MKKTMIIVGVIVAVLAVGGLIKLVSNGYFNKSHETIVSAEVPEGYEAAIFAGGCFWCMEKPFEELDGVLSVTSGYTGGDELNPTYEQVSSHSTGHVEAVQIVYDPEVIAYDTLLDVYWRQVDPTDNEGQFVDRGSQYRPVIFYLDDEQKAMAEQSKKELDESGIFDKPIVTEILPAKQFYVAEDYHQDYYKTNPAAYEHYRGGSGRDEFLDSVWADQAPLEIPMASKSLYSAENPYDSEAAFVKPSDEELKASLTEVQYDVTQNEGTETPFSNEYDKNYEEGIYVDIVSGEPLYSSIDKFDSGTGWPSFTQPMEGAELVEVTDNTLLTERTEIRSKKADSHIGHVFDDGPEPTGLRYCMNSAAMLFIPKEELVESGYGQYSYLFE